MKHPRMFGRPPLYRCFLSNGQVGQGVGGWRGGTGYSSLASSRRTLATGPAPVRHVSRLWVGLLTAIGCNCAAWSYGNVMTLDWKANTIRFSLFPVAGASVHQLDPWKEVVGGQPDTEESRVKEGVRRQSGPYRSGIVTVLVTPLRIDITLGPSAPPVAPPATLPSATAPVSTGDYFEEFGKLHEAVADWLPGCGIPIQRVAIGGVALAPARDIDDAYEMVASQLRSVTVSPAMRDLVFRVNWRKDSAVPEAGAINRIAAWSVVGIGMGMITVGSNQTHTMQEFFAAVELDFSTPSERTHPFDAAQLEPILGELYDLAREILRDGECPSI